MVPKNTYFYSSHPESERGQGDAGGDGFGYLFMDLGLRPCASRVMVMGTKTLFAQRTLDLTDVKNQAIVLTLEGVTFFLLRYFV